MIDDNNYTELLKTLGKKMKKYNTYTKYHPKKYQEINDLSRQLWDIFREKLEDESGFPNFLEEFIGYNYQWLTYYMP